MASVSNTMMDKAGPSKTFVHKKTEMSITRNKQDITNAMEVCRQILKKRNIINDKPDVQISFQPTLLGKHIAELIINMLEEYDNVTVKIEECSSEDNNFLIEGTSSNAENSSPENIIKNSIIPLDVKKKVVQMAEENPFWSLKLLQKEGSVRLQNKSDIKKWKRDIENRGTYREKYKLVSEMTYELYCQAKSEGKYICVRDIQHMARDCARQFPKFRFVASPAWVNTFKIKYNIHDPF